MFKVNILGLTVNTIKTKDFCQGLANAKLIKHLWGGGFSFITVKNLVLRGQQPENL